MSSELRHHFYIIQFVYYLRPHHSGPGSSAKAQKPGPDNLESVKLLLDTQRIYMLFSERSRCTHLGQVKRNLLVGQMYFGVDLLIDVTFLNL